MSLTYKRLLNMLAVTSVAAYFVEVGMEMEGDFRFLLFERLVATIFTVELFVQLRREHQYWKTGEFIVDILSILPFYAGFFVPAQSLGIIRTMRVFRLLKLFWHNDSFTVMKNAFALAWPSVKNVGFCLICLALFCSAILFQVEPTTFGTIGNTLYFVLTTITTIGFGDYSPKTGPGKAITIFLLYGPSLMVCGSLIGVVCSSYQTSLEKFNKDKHESN